MGGPTEGLMGGRTDRRTDGETDIPSYGDATAHIKMLECLCI